MQGFGENQPTRGDPGVGSDFFGLGIIGMQLDQGSNAGVVGHEQDILASLSPTFVRHTDPPGIVLIGTSKLSSWVVIVVRLITCCKVVSTLKNFIEYLLQSSQHFEE